MIEERFSRGSRVDAAHAAVVGVGFHGDEVLAGKRCDGARGRRMRDAEIVCNASDGAGLAAGAGEIAEHGPLAGVDRSGSAAFVNGTRGLLEQARNSTS